jgi:hypothetical protein
MNERELQHMVVKASGSLANSLVEYWPSEGNNEFCEQNAVMHLACILNNSGFCVYGECHFKGGTDKRLDLLALRSKDAAQIMVEAKRLYSAEKVAEIIDDVNRLVNFRLIDKELDGVLKDKFCVLLATTWNDGYAQWWSSANGEEPTDNANWAKLNGHPALQEAIWGSQVLQGYSPDKECTEGFQYLLYCIFRQPSPVRD